MVIEKYEIVKEYRFKIDGIDGNVKARIVKPLIKEATGFSWEISHYGAGSLSAGTYYPSTSRDTFEETEKWLMSYVDDVLSCNIKVVKNTNYPE